MRNKETEKLYVRENGNEDNESYCIEKTGNYKALGERERKGEDDGGLA